MKFYRYALNPLYCRWTPILQCFEYILLRETPKGYWIISTTWSHCSSNFKEKHKRWVSNSARKRFAYPDKKQALIAYQKRTIVYLKILKSRIKDSEEGLKRCERIMEAMEE